MQRYGQGPRDTHMDGNGATPSRAYAPPGGSHQYGEARRTLHLSLPQDDAASSSEAHPAGGRNVASDGRPSARAQGDQPGFVQQSGQATGGTRPFTPPSSPSGYPGESQRAKQGGTFIDHSLRERIDGDIAAFLAAFDAALDHDTAESRTELREATDRLLRAGARTRIELERLEARIPLPSRDKNAQASSLFRPR